MVSYVVDIALSVTHLGKVIRGYFDLVLGILNFAFKYGPDRIEQKQLRDTSRSLLLASSRPSPLKSLNMYLSHHDLIHNIPPETSSLSRTLRC